MESILTSIKKLLGIAEEYTHFDTDLIMHINSIFPVLTQLGVGPADGFSILDDTATWDDFLGEGHLLNTVKSFMYLRVRLLFDPPMSSASVDAMNRIASEFEWRINVLAETIQSNSEEGSIDGDV